MFAPLALLLAFLTLFVTASPIDASLNGIDSQYDGQAFPVQRSSQNGKWNPKDFFDSASACRDQTGDFDKHRGTENNDYNDCACFYNNWQARDRMKDCLSSRFGYGASQEGLKVLLPPPSASEEAMDQDGEDDDEDDDEGMEDADMQETEGDEDGEQLPLEYRETQRGKPCFHASNHDGHETEFSISSGNGGCCDCGDVEAWKIQPDCEYHSVSRGDHRMTEAGEGEIPNVKPLPETIRSTLVTVLEFIVDVLTASPTPKNSDLSSDTFWQKNPPDQVPLPTGMEAPHDLYSVILWNDELHSFDEVIDKVMTATRCSREQAVQVADSVDTMGRDIVTAQKSLQKSLHIARGISSPTGTAHGSLTVTVRLADDAYRETVASFLVSWLRNLLRRAVGVQKKDGETYESAADVVREILCEVLCAPRLHVRSQLAGKAYDEDTFHSSGPEPCRLDYLMAFEFKFWKSLRNTLKELYISVLVVQGEDYKKFLVTAKRFAHCYLMMSHVYLLEDREWDLSIINLSVQLLTVPTIAAQLVESTNFIAVLFNIFKCFFMSEIYPTSCNIQKFYTTYEISSSARLPHYPKLLCELRLPFRSTQYPHILNDIQYLLGTPQVASSLFRRFCAEGLDAFLDACCVFQGMNPQRREHTYHVAYESMGWIGAFPISVNLCGMIDRVHDTFAPTTVANVEEDFAFLVQAIKRVVRKLDAWCAYEQQREGELFLEANPESNLLSNGVNTWAEIGFVEGVRPVKVLSFDVGSGKVSFHYPLHWFLAALLSLIPYYLKASPRLRAEFEPSTLFDIQAHSEEVNSYTEERELKLFKPSKRVRADSDPLEELEPPGPLDQMFTRNLSPEDRYSRIMDYAIRVKVFLAQIHAGLWVRNGQSLRDQAYTFYNHLLRDLGDHYVYLLQSACAVIGPDRFLITVIDKYGISPWFTGSPKIFKYFKVEAKKLEVIVEDFLHLVVNVYTERAKSSVMSIENQIRRELIQMLAVHRNGLQFSKIGEFIPDRLTRTRPLYADLQTREDGSTEFQARPRHLEQILKDLSTFKFPENASDFGTYLIREDLLMEADPWFYHYSKTQGAEMESILAEYGEKQLNGLSKEFLLKALVSGEENETVMKAFKYRARPPKVTLVESSSYFTPLNALGRYLSFVKIIFFGLYNLTRPNDTVVSDKIMSALTHLILYAVRTDVELIGTVQSHETFANQAATVGFDVPEPIPGLGDNLTILDIMLYIMNRYDEEHYRDYIDRFCYAVFYIAKIVGPIADAKLKPWRERHRLHSHEDEVKAQSDEKAKRKAASKQRQAALMAQFQNQQKAFMQNFAHDEDFIQEKVSKDDEIFEESLEATIQTIPNERESAFEAGNCIVCQEEMSVGTKEYGLLSLMQTCQIERSRFLNLDNADALKSLIEREPSLDEEQQTTRSAAASLKSPAPSRKDAKSTTVSLPLPSRTPDLYLSTCGHMMHLACFDVYKASIVARVNQDDRLHPEDVERHEFLCPLCKTLGNCVVPVLAKNVKEHVNWSGSTGSNQETGGYTNAALDLDSWRTTRAHVVEDALKGSTHEAPQPATSPTPQEPPSPSPSGSGMIGRFFTFFRRGSVSAQTSQPPVVSEERRSEATLRVVSGIFPYILPALEAITKESMNGSFYDRLLFCVASTISGIERASRGIPSKSSFRQDHGRTGFKRIDVLENVTKPTLAMLRLVTHAVLQLRPFERSFAQSTSARRSSNSALAVLIRDDKPLDLPLIRKDAFDSLVENTLVLDFHNDLNLDDAFGIFAVFWTFEIARFFVAAVESIAISSSWDNLRRDLDMMDVEPKHPEVASILRDLTCACLDVQTSDFADSLPGKVDLADILKIARLATLPFLRRASIYLAVKLNMVPPSGEIGFGYENPAEDDFKKNEISEFEHLRAYLKLPDIVEVLRAATQNGFQRSIFLRCAQGARSGLSGRMRFLAEGAEELPPAIPVFERAIVLKDPTPFSLIELPLKLESLFEDCFKRVCNKCKRNIPEPGLCLICGTFVCSQSFCCQEDDKGECNVHMKEYAVFLSFS
ncbi:hypothetical protein HDU96_003243 [Phlyctochytrium bullatum]|nr:hypothetical protein HDU96_003243 [Phlyctochytrium bullatum]